MSELRVVPNYEKKKRGCQYCALSEKAWVRGALRICCTKDQCPYTVLDKYSTYEEFMASEDSKIMVDQFFDTAAGCYVLSAQGRSPRRTVSDGDYGSSL